LIEAIRSNDSSFGSIEDLLHEYSLSTSEGLALMVLAEALLRVPDAATADRFIEDRITQADFSRHESKSDALLVNVSRWALSTASNFLQPNEMPLARLAKRIGMPAIRAATRQAMRIMGDHFVLGETIETAITHAGADPAARYSFDMLGEGARTSEDAQRYFASYAHAIEAIGRSSGSDRLPNRPGISVKLSALHPRYEAVHRDRVLAELVPSVTELARRAKAYDLNFTIDAEEADRLELSLDVIAAVFSDGSLADWDGFGLAIQAYQKRAEHVVDYVADLAARLNRRMMVRLVKGAYWDTEIKRAQERGLDDYPVFTRKAMTDLNYLACAHKLLSLRPRIFPQFATHNALTVASILQMASAHGADFEFQRLYGMGEALYMRLRELRPDIACRTYAPVGCHRDLLAYLVRRLLENGANSSFVSLAGDKRVPVGKLLQMPLEIVRSEKSAQNSSLPLPPVLYGPGRRNSAGIELGDRQALAKLFNEVSRQNSIVDAASVVDGEFLNSENRREVFSPIDGKPIGFVSEAGEETIDKAMSAALKGYAAWSETPVAVRAAALEAAAALLEQRRARFIALLQREAGKTLDDSIAEVREAVDFCRYYAVHGRAHFGEGETLPGPTGESNMLRLRGRGAFVAISPWNFPLAIFTGQITAALVAGNSVVAKPAQQTPLIATEAIRLLYEAGIPVSALHLVLGGRDLGARLVEHKNVAGVVFTGSTRAARLINQTLARKDGPIVPLIAETGGINAMIVDATALPEQAVDDIVASAFRSAGQRCSALRLLFVQEDVADHLIHLLVGATQQRKVGDPRDITVDVGPIIDAEAKQKISAHIERLKGCARMHYAGEVPATGTFVAPHLIEIDRAAVLTEEIFGPVLHIVRYRADDIEGVVQAIAATGYGLTLGVQTRIDGLVERISKLPVGNVYVNRNMIGAVVGVQPFGGQGLSGTGPKAGGPHYLMRFASEQTITVNTAAVGGNAALMTAS
jgi:RHH-type proline utilization regulon transcriptional repressor/proline dehydrogenase/delta 1-pyrroline-5-carboxylate dehydrogenase